MSIEQSVSAATLSTRATPVERSPASRRTEVHAIQFWLRVVAGCIFLMVIVGGATRLTESGLSITEWEPLFGAIPPLTAAAWDAKFEAYRQIPQFALHTDMTLGEFKAIFFWEWTHRLIGQLLGLIIALPLAFFWLSGRLPSRLKPRLVGLLLLVGLQGAVGWWMVKSGLTERTEVSQYRLATHLLLATATLAYVVWLERGLALRSHEDLGPRPGAIRAAATALIALIFLQIGLGALVAGLRAGFVFNSWPLMDGGVAPPITSLAFLHPLWRNLFENAATVQFQHRMTAYLLLAAAVAHALQLRRRGRGAAAARRGLGLAILVAAQAAIGITTLVLVVPLGAALAHQAFAMVVLVAAVAHRRDLGQTTAAEAASSA